MLMVLGSMMLGDIVAEVFNARLPLDVNLCVFDLVHDPKVAHFHCTGALALDRVIDDAHRCGIVTVDGSRWLRMPHLMQDDSDDFGFLHIEK